MAVLVMADGYDYYEFMALGRWAIFLHLTFEKCICIGYRYAIVFCIYVYTFPRLPPPAPCSCVHSNEMKTQLPHEWMQCTTFSVKDFQ